MKLNVDTTRVKGRMVRIQVNEGPKVVITAHRDPEDDPVLVNWAAPEHPRSPEDAIEFAKTLLATALESRGDKSNLFQNREAMALNLLDVATQELDELRLENAKLKATMLEIRAADAGGHCGALAFNALEPINSSVVHREGNDALSQWFGLSYASWLTCPRVLLEAMPDAWQGALAQLLFLYDNEWKKWPEALGTRVQVTGSGGKLIKTPGWLLNYRHPDRDVLDSIRGGVE